eukprot:scaffold70018_cov75-Phaeocystis_antarctica.AAC.3
MGERVSRIDGAGALQPTLRLLRLIQFEQHGRKVAGSLAVRVMRHPERRSVRICSVSCTPAVFVAAPDVISCSRRHPVQTVWPSCVRLHSTDAELKHFDCVSNRSGALSLTFRETV